MDGDGTTGADETATGRLTQDFLGRIGSRIRALRTQQGLTVQQLADRAQLSRRLLTQIEHGQANPSLVAITRIARALGSDVTALLAENEPQTALVGFDAAAQTRVWSSAAGSTAHLLVATSPARTADLWRWQLMPGDGYRGNADPTGSQELFHVLRGRLTLHADNADLHVGAGGSARLLSDRAYAYRNDTDEPVTFVRVVSLAR